MQVWMEGYESDIEYTSGYYREQEPNFLNLCAVMHGIEPINLDKGFTYCELGCGQGMTVLIMAANYPMGKFYAIDFNPSHIARARNLAEQAGLDNIVFLEKSFAQLAEDPELLPECDFIVLHGIFTWVSDHNRQCIIDICSRHLKSGGMVYNSYNAKPGWSMSEPIQKMLFAAGKLFSGNSISRFDQSLALIKELETVNPRFFSLNKDTIKSRLEMLSSKNKNYLVHEYFHEGWRAFYFTEIAAYMAAAKLNFIGGAVATDAYVDTLLPPASSQLLRKIPDKDVRELFKDVILNTVFRKDIYKRGVSHLEANTQVEWLRKTRWVSRKVLSAEQQTTFKFKSALGEVDGKTEVYRPIVELLAAQPHTVAELQAKLALPFKDLLQSLMFLYQEELVGIQYADTPVPSALRLNAVLLGQLFTAQKANYVALPALRSSIGLGLIDMLFYHAVLVCGEVENSDTLVNYAARELTARGLNLKHEDKTLVGDAMRERLRESEQVWRHTVLPVLQVGGALR